MAVYTRPSVSVLLTSRSHSDRSGVSACREKSPGDEGSLSGKRGLMREGVATKVCARQVKTACLRIMRIVRGGS